MDFNISKGRLKSILEDEQAKIYLINKAKNIHSFKLVSKLRQVLNMKKVGFSGTLDPLATGLMILATGRATKLLDYFHQFPKVYKASIEFGKVSDTYDIDGKVEINNNVKEFNKKVLEKVLKKFLGKQKQVVPIYSAKKIKGTKLHVLARKGKKIILPKSDIEFYYLKIKKFKYPNLILEVKCSAGTYIRSLVNDLGKELKTGAVLTDLERISIGEYNIKNSLEFVNINNINLKKNSINPKEIIKYLYQ